MEKIIAQDIDKDILDVLTIALDQEGYITLSVENCEKILEKINKFRPHVGH